MGSEANTDTNITTNTNTNTTTLQSVRMEVVLSSMTEYGERYEEKELLGEGGFGKVKFLASK